MALAFFDDDRYRAAQFLVPLLHYPGLAVEPRIAAATHMQHRHPGLSQPGEAVERLDLRHPAPQDRVLDIDARDLVWVLDRPGVGLPCGAPSPRQHWLFRESGFR